MDNLAIWSLVALCIRLLALAGFLFVGRLQLREFRFQSSLQPLKKLLLAAVVVLFISNVPIMYLHYLRIFAIPPEPWVTSFATVSNALGMLVVATLLYLIYVFRSDDDNG